MHLPSWFIVSSLVCCSLTYLGSARAQIIPDSTLGTESSVVTDDQIIKGIPSDRIDGGAIRSRNLFHSFQEFNIEPGRGAYFTNPSGIENILTRVTGSNVSNILGTLGVLGNANLFFMNPNGIVFGQNARLDVNGSFLATTANSILFENSLKFNSTNPEAPPLLTITAPIGLGLEKNPANIANNSLNLEVNHGNTLALVGGNVTLDGATVQTSGGRLELGGLAGEGIVNLNIQTSEEPQKLTSLSFPDSVERADISLSNQSVVNVIGENNGGIAINGRNVNIIGGSTLKAGIAAGQGNPENQAGDIKINATDKVVVDDISGVGNPSGAFNLVEKGAIGNSGNIEIHAKTVEVTNGGQLNASTVGTGNAGKIAITTTYKVVFDGQSVYGCGNACISSALSQVESGAKGNSGGIEINAKTVEVTNGGQLNASTVGTGNSGKIEINTTDKVIFDGQSLYGFISSAFSLVGKNAVGNSGGIEINAGSVDITNGGQLSANTLGKGDAGKIQITANDRVTFNGQSAYGFLSSAFSQVREEAVGNSGGIEINAGSVEVNNGGQLSSTTLAKGDAGKIQITATGQVLFNGISGAGLPSSALSEVATGAVGNSGGIEIKADTLQVTNGGQLNTTTVSTGNAGKILITTTDKVIFDGQSVWGCDNACISSAFSMVGNNAVGNSGGIEINAGSVDITNGGQLSANTLARGNAGKIQINARDRVVIDGQSPYGNLSAVFSQVLAGAVGNSGGIEIQAGSVDITNGGQLSATTVAKGDAGKIQITGTEKVVFDGKSKLFGSRSSAFSQVFGGSEGNSGGIEINAGIFELTQGGLLDASTLGTGNAGTIKITANDQAILNTNSYIASQVTSTATGNAGGISVNTKFLEILNDSFLSATTFGEGDAGNIIINAPQSVSLANNSSLTVEASNSGKSGDISITTDNLNLTEASLISATATATATGEQGGKIRINASRINLANTSNILAETQGIVSAGTITLTPDNSRPTLDITLAPGSKISASTSGSGNGGDLLVSLPQAINISGQGKLAVETTGTGNAGNIEITTQKLTLTDGVQISASTDSSGKAGNISLKVSENITLAGTGTGLFASTSENSTGKSGSIIIDPRIMTIQDGAKIAVDSQGESTGGDIELASGLLTLNNGSISAKTRSNTGGNITLNLQELLVLRNGSQISTTAGNQEFGGNGGNITINSPFIVAIPRENSDITANAFSGNGGIINIITNGIFGIFSQDSPSIFSDITASSELGVRGIVAINTPDVDPNNGLVALPIEGVDASSLINQNFCAVRGGSSFTITGRGGLPSSPNEALNANAVWEDWELTAVTTVKTENYNPPQAHDLYDATKIVEAQGWIINERGEATLVANAPTVTPQGLSDLPSGCQLPN